MLPTKIELCDSVDPCLFVNNSQSGFLRLHSTLTCLLKNTDDWYNGLDLGKLVGLVFIDLKRHLTQLIMAYSVKNWSIMVFKSGN